MCRWGWRLLAAAARSGSVPLMSLLRERGCAWDAITYVAALQSGNCEACLWLQQHGCQLPRSDMPCWRAAIAHGDVRTLRLLQQQLGRACRGLLPPPTPPQPHPGTPSSLTPGQLWLRHQQPLAQQLAEAWYRRAGGSSGGAAAAAGGAGGGGGGGGAARDGGAPAQQQGGVAGAAQAAAGATGRGAMQDEGQAGPAADDDGAVRLLGLLLDGA